MKFDSISHLPWSKIFWSVLRTRHWT